MDDYTCTLEDKYIKKAKNDLNEVPSKRLTAVQALRDWIIKQKHLKYDTSTLSILKILRYVRFDLWEAKKAVEKICKFVYNNRKFFCDIDTSNEEIQTFTRRGQLIILPGYDNQGRKVVIQRLNVIPMDELRNQFLSLSSIRSMNAIFSTIANDEMYQINGLMMLTDISGINLKDLNLQNDPAIQKYYQEINGKEIEKIEGIHFYNINGFFEAIYSFCRLIMKKESIETVRVHETLESIYQVIPRYMLPIEYLPENYDGANAGSVENLANSLADELLEKKDEILEISSLDNFYYDESLR